jgi:pectin methylesterase-like acyl-CoA thioesterase
MPMPFGKLALTLALGLTLTGCAATAGGETKAALCDQFRPIRWSSQDTPETVAQSKAHNAVGKAICRWTP